MPALAFPAASIRCVVDDARISAQLNQASTSTAATKQSLHTVRVAKEPEQP